jgi:hypothetical protein
MNILELKRIVDQAADLDASLDVMVQDSHIPLIGHEVERVEIDEHISTHTGTTKKVLFFVIKANSRA